MLNKRKFYLSRPGQSNRKSAYRHRQRICIVVPQSLPTQKQNPSNAMTNSETNPFGFPHAELTRIPNRPDAQSIKLLRKELYANSLIVPSTRGGGANGHLGLVMPLGTYFIRAGEPYLEPDAPGLQAAHIANATNAQIIEANRQFDKNAKEFSIHTSVKCVWAQIPCFRVRLGANPGSSILEKYRDLLYFSPGELANARKSCTFQRVVPVQIRARAEHC